MRWFDLFQGYLSECERNSEEEDATHFPGLFHFTLDTYLIMLSVEQGGIK